ncbi:hypothetical protein CU098_008345 [Rhizopus stolonifer]|uniref:dual-specificity kinase n=1 Tax=Rhizopus stolonifer TaxID=4846 RepID=A0A367KME9_RHIST|nr:hypothetical protein CU098_008345 [Rhizopus stolonifer]
MSDSQLITEYDSKPSTTSLSSEPWNKVQSTYAAKRRQIQAERMKQLKELEDKVTETTNWNQKRKEWMNTSRGPIEQNQRKHSEDVLDDLEGLIAASTKRLANYRLRHQKTENQNSTYLRVKHLFDSSGHTLDTISTTRSTLPNPSPKIESPRISSSTTARASMKKPASPPNRSKNLSSFVEKSTGEDPVIKPRRVKLSITNNISTVVTPSKKVKDIKPTISVPTLPGSLALPPVTPITLPPMKVEPLNIPATKPHTHTLAKTPTRIPLPGASRSAKSTEEPKLVKSKSIQQPTMRKLKSNSTLTPKLQTSKSNKSADDNLLRKNSVDNHVTQTQLVSATTTKRKVSTLQERLQGLVDESKSWTSQMKQDKKPEVASRSRVSTVEDGSKALNYSKVHMRVAMSPEAAQKLYQFNLTSYEKTEMLNYDQIYFVGHHAQKRPNSPTKTACNYGYDDERGDYLIQLRDHLDYRYEVLEVMGKGSFGQVLKCFDHRTGQTAAIKIIRNKKRFHAQALVEIKILEDLLVWDPEDKHNNVRMLGHFTFRNHLCIAFECLSINLYEFIKINEFRGFSMGLLRRFTVQLLNSLVLLQKHKLIHCDLKPENILLKHPRKSTIKVIDFGSSCLEIYTYIQSRFYRSPEVIMGMSYNMSIDMWSTGCILAELHTGYPLFPGENEQEQLACIMEVLGVPDSYLIEKSSRRKLFFDSLGDPRVVTNSKGRKRRPSSKSLEHALNTSDEHFINFISKCLIWDPEKRIKPEEALRHPWMQKTYSRKS